MTEQSWMDGLMRVFTYNRETCPALSLEDGDCCSYLNTGDKRLPIFGQWIFENGGPNNDYVGEECHRPLEQLAKAAMTTLKTGKKYSAT